MKKLFRLILILVVICALCGGFVGVLQKLGCTDVQIGKAEKIYDKVKVKLSENWDAVSDRLGELVLGSDSAYSTTVSLYAKTRRAARYDLLDEQAMDADEWELDEATRLAGFTGIFGKPGAWYSAEKNPYSEGTDRWYVFGRFGEENGVALPEMGETNRWLNEAEAWAQVIYQEENPEKNPEDYAPMEGYRAMGAFVARGEEKIYPRAIAVCDGHLLYIEDVHFVNGKPEEVYFTEADGKGETGVLDDWDGVLLEEDYEDFIAHRDILGYIVPMNIFT